MLTSGSLASFILFVCHNKYRENITNSAQKAGLEVRCPWHLYILLYLPPKLFIMGTEGIFDVYGGHASCWFPAVMTLHSCTTLHRVHREWDSMSEREEWAWFYSDMLALLSIIYSVLKDNLNKACCSFFIATVSPCEKTQKTVDPALYVHALTINCTFFFFFLFTLKCM